MVGTTDSQSGLKLVLSPSGRCGEELQRNTLCRLIHWGLRNSSKYSSECDFSRRLLDKRPSGSTVDVQLHQRYFWNRQWGGYSTRCTEAEVIAKTPIPVNNAIYCYVNCSSSTFPATGVSTVMISTDCDENPLIKSWSGELYTILNLPLTTSITIGYYSAAWFGPLLYPAAGQYWMVANRMNLAPRPDGYINSSPVTTTLPVLFKPVGQSLVHVIQVRMRSISAWRGPFDKASLMDDKNIAIVSVSRITSSCTIHRWWTMIAQTYGNADDQIPTQAQTTTVSMNAKVRAWDWMVCWPFMETTARCSSIYPRTGLDSISPLPCKSKTTTIQHPLYRWALRLSSFSS